MTNLSESTARVKGESLHRGYKSFSLLDRDYQIDFFARFNFGFVLLKEKQPFTPGWQNKPQTAKQAKAHRGTIGVLAGEHSDKIVWFEIDENFPGFLECFPILKTSLTITRPDNPFRGKVAVKITDRLPRSTAYKPAGCDHPLAEFKSTGTQVAVVGIHGDGELYEHNSKAPIEMTFADVSAIWRTWTTQELPDPVAPKDFTPRTPRAVAPRTDVDDLSAKVKAHWSAGDVFKHFQKPTGKGHYTKTSRKGDLWFDNAIGAGGDAINAWAICTNRTVTPENFRPILCEMADAAGIEYSKKLPGIEIVIDGQPVRLDASDVFGPLFDHFSKPQNYPIILLRQTRKLKEPLRSVDTETGEILHEVTEEGVIVQRRNKMARIAMMAILDTMRHVGRIEAVSISCRELGEKFNGNYDTALKALHLLQQYGFIVHVDGRSWYSGSVFTGKGSVDTEIADSQNAFCYSLTSLAIQVCGIGTLRSGSASASQCPKTAHIPTPTVATPSTSKEEGKRGAGCAARGATCTSAAKQASEIGDYDVSTLLEYMAHDAFAHGARESRSRNEHQIERPEDDRELLGDSHKVYHYESLGKSALDLVCALSANNDLSYDEIAAATGLTRSTVSKKAKALEKFGLVEVYQDGRKKRVYLVQNWRERLDRVAMRLTTYCKHVDRVIRHLSQRIKMIRGQLDAVESGQLHKALCERLEKYLKKIVEYKAKRKSMREFLDKLSAMEGKAETALERQSPNFRTVEKRRILAEYEQNVAVN